MSEEDAGGIQPEDAVVEESDARRQQYWLKRGAPESDVIAPILSSFFFGGSEWPNTREQWRIVRCEKSVVLASDGLSTPFTDEEEGVDVQGFGCELFLETPDLVGLGFDDIAGGFHFQLLKGACDEIAAIGGFGDAFETRSALSIQFPVGEHDVPERFLHDGDQIGALLCPSAPGRPAMELPLGPAHMVAVTLLTGDETARAAAGDQAAVIESRRRASPEFWHWTSLSREVGAFGRDAP